MQTAWPWPASHGKLGQRILTADWQSTSLGPLHDWPQRLRGVVDMVLRHARPALLLHGPAQFSLYNDACAELIGEIHPALLAQPLARGWPELRDATHADIDAAMSGLTRYRHAVELGFRHEGRTAAACLALAFTPIADDQGNPIGVLLIIEDVTHQRRLARTLHRDARKLSAMFEHAQVGLSELGLDGRFLRVNESLCRMLGRSRETLLASGVPDVTYADDIGNSLIAVGGLAADGVPVSIDKRYLRQDGTIVWANSSISRLDPVAPDAPYTLLVVTVDLTERTLAKQALAENEARFRVLAEASPVLIWQVDPHMHMTYMNPKCREMFGDIDQPDKSWVTILHPDDATAYVAAAKEAMVERKPFRQRTRARTVDEKLVWLEVYAGPWFRINGDYAGHVGIAIDVTEMVHAHEELVVINDRLNLAIDGSGDGVWDWNLVTNEVSYSRRMKEIIGFAETDHFDTNQAWVRRIHRDDLPATMAALDACLRGETRAYNAEYRMRCKDNIWKWILARAIVVARDEQGRPLRMTGTVTDISDERQSQEVVWLHANFDALTGLPNRRLFRDRLDHETRSAHRNGSRFALLFIDLDHFKEANDLLGHDAGDQLLAQAARRIMNCVRESDTVARLGGDEFTAILTQLEELADAETIARNMNEALAAPFMLGNEVVHLSASIGITLYPTDACTPEELIRNADQAMYVAKNGGRNQFNYFTPEMQHRAQDRLRLIADLRGALAGGQLEVYYQPVVDLPSSRVVKAEALLRWNHPRHGLLEPAAFIPFAEESGLILEIGDWVFQQAAACCQRWRSIAGDGFQISVNRSPTQFMARANGTNWPYYLERLGMKGSSMSVEITEAVLLNASSRVERQLLQYRDAGIQVAIDDFGTGYSSLAYLKKFEIDYLKIDQSFVNDVCHNESDRAIVRSVTAMAHELGLQVIAEGIETGEQHNLLVAAGCDFGQGFHYAKPMPSAGFERLLMRSLWPQ